ncbi:hypothetical protein RhiirA4_457086 [Rhizophagus irregularis]|uniref:G-protein coupled receptors family 2 profile 2 domain-containing protein n=1 Tax=Rhizophagus irregularis TaxID=588596 RepID=A0A2I1G934_9GLOM|nr:hypothetical protein RhiirA4_457086 [Rhizophagus irregularis]
MGLSVMIINIVYLISFICSIYIALSLLKLRKNPLIGIYCCAYCLLCCNILSGVIFKNDLSSAPKAFCFFQGYMVQFICYITSMSAICFSHEIYSLLMNHKHSTFFESKKGYYLLIILYPLIMGIPLFIICFKTDAIIPRELKCDVANPIWVRLLGYSGANFILSIPGMYFSARSAYILYKHLDRFKDFSLNEDTSQSSQTFPNSPNSQITQSPISRQFSQTKNNLDQKRYSLTKEAVIRMSILSSSIILIHCLGSIGTIISVLTHESLSKKVNLNDWAGSVIGICTFLIFGFSKEIRNAWH